MAHEGIEAVASLGEPTRRRVYEHVSREPQPVGKDDVASTLGLPRTTAGFHLDRLADEGLLDVDFQRRSGRTGPGAGRPAKLYQRSRSAVAVSLPPRHYDLVGELLAAAIEDAEGDGGSPREALARRARRVGADLLAGPGEVHDCDDVVAALTRYGFEPRDEDRRVVLGNCPFHDLAERHTDLVCSMNHALVAGLVDAASGCRLQPRLDPAPGERCCVVLESSDSV